jgi:hypothetical protein
MAPPRSNLSNPLDEMEEQAKSGGRQVQSLQRHFDYWFSLVDLVWLKPGELTQKVAYEFWRAAGENPGDPMIYWKTAEEHLWGPGRESVRNAAHLMWEVAGSQPGEALSYWLAAEKYIGSLVAVARQVTGSTIPNQASLGTLIDAFSPAAYLRLVEQLAERMAEDAEFPPAVLPHDFWLAAERHVLVLIASAAHSVNSLLDAANKLTATLRDFRPERYLQPIREAAYYLWEAAGAQTGKSLSFWLEAEQEYLKNIAEGTKSPAGPTPPR